jgi:hypothetical protein
MPEDSNLSHGACRLQTAAIVGYTPIVVPDGDTAEPGTARPWLRRVCIVALFTLLTVVMTWPMARVLGSRSVEHHDVLFNVWRLAWVQHALATSSPLFDANQFYPERHVLAYSDAMLVEGLIAAPLFAAGLRPLLIHNLMLLGAIAASGVGMFTLARYLSRRTGAAILAGLVFAFAPYRFGHIMHMELQWAMWIPWAFWAMQRTLDTGRLKFGLLTGAFIALQIGSSIYYGIFLVILLTVAGAVQMPTVPRPRWLKIVGAFGAGAAIALSVAIPYSRPYRAASSQVGVRTAPEILVHSARPSSYLLTTEGNYLYGRWYSWSNELSLFPGYVPLVLALVALVAIRPSAVVISYVIGLLLAFDLSLGLNGLVYPVLHDHVGVLKGLRAPARASIFFLMFLAALAAHGCAAVLRPLPVVARMGAIVAIGAAILLEYWVVPLRLWPYPDRPPLYTFLARQPDGIVAEFPVPRIESLPAHDARYAYMSIFHWKRLVNGYSGYYPPSYIARIERLAAFPDTGSLAQLRADGVRYVIVHEGSYIRPGESAGILAALEREGVKPMARLYDGWAAATVFELSSP